MKRKRRVQLMQAGREVHHKLQDAVLLYSRLLSTQWVWQHMVPCWPCSRTQAPRVSMKTSIYTPAGTLGQCSSTSVRQASARITSLRKSRTCAAPSECQLLAPRRLQGTRCLAVK